MFRRLRALEKEVDRLRRQLHHRKRHENPNIIASNIIGHVKWFNVKDGFGFITREDSTDVFVHMYGILKSNPEKAKPSLGEGERVKFDIIHVPGHTPEAIHVTAVDGTCVRGSDYAPYTNSIDSCRPDVSEVTPTISCGDDPDFHNHIDALEPSPDMQSTVSVDDNLFPAINHDTDVTTQSTSSPVPSVEPKLMKTVAVADDYRNESAGGENVFLAVDNVESNNSTTSIPSASSFTHVTVAPPQEPSILKRVRYLPRLMDAVKRYSGLIKSTPPDIRKETFIV